MSTENRPDPNDEAGRNETTPIDDHDLHPAEPGSEGLSAPTSIEAEIAEVLGKITDYAGFRVKLELKATDDGYYVNIRTRSSDGIIIGKRGETLRSLQYILKAILKRRYPDFQRITLDVGGYRLRRENFLRKKAVAIAKIVLETRREMALDPLTDKERTVVEEVLRPLTGIRTYTIGSGIRKNVIVAPT